LSALGAVVGGTLVVPVVVVGGLVVVVGAVVAGPAPQAVRTIAPAMITPAIAHAFLLVIFFLP
jgi:hypothetical protein